MKNDLFFIFAGLFYKGNIEQKKSDQEKGKKNPDLDINIKKIHTLAFSSNSKAVSMQSVARMISAVKEKILSQKDKSETMGAMKMTPIHPAAKLVKSPERTLSLDGLKNMLIGKAYASEHDGVKFNYLIINSQ